MAERKRKNLSERELRVLHALVSHPMFNDREISEITGINISTVIAIKKRLSARNVFKTAILPNFHKLGMELFLVGYTPIPPGPQKEVIGQWRTPVEREERLFYAGAANDMAFFMGTAENYTSAMALWERIQRGWAENNLMLDKVGSLILLPLTISRFLTFCDYNNIVRRALYEAAGGDAGIMVSEEDKGVSGPYLEGWGGDDGRGRSLSKKERKVFKALVMHPEATNKKIGEVTGVSRQGVAAIKSRLLEEGFYVVRRIPDLQALGFEILVLAHTVFSPVSTVEAREEAIRYMEEHVPQFFMISSNTQNVLMAAARNYEEFVHYKNQVLSLYRRMNFINDEPTITLMPLTELIHVKYHDYGGAIKIALGQE
ncbi:MAG: hypothetical protein J7L61_00430 [Thermoplasmata archaeon]|nr:hypothetical protein [Thermoplasmata archaeon]